MDILSTIDYNIKSFSELINKKKIYESDIERREKEVEQYAERLKFLKCTKELYLNAVDLMYQESIGVLQETLNSAMQYVMKDKDYSVKLELEDKRGAKTLNLALIDNEKGFDYEGKHYTNYEGTQLQRKIETAIREQKETQILAESSENELLMQDSSRKLRILNKKYREVSSISGLPTKMERLKVIKKA